MTEDPDAVGVDELVARAKLLDGGDVIEEPVVAEVSVVIVVERLGAERRPEVVELDDDEAQGRERELLSPVLEAPGSDRADLRPRVDVRDDRVLLRRIDGRRQIEHAVYIGHPIARLDGEDLTRLPADGL